MHKKTKKPIDSETIKTEIICPNDTNPMGILMGGRLVEWMDIAAAVCAQTHAEKICVTAIINKVLFKEAARVGDVLYIKARMTRAFSTSMEIKVEATAHNALSGNRYPISIAYFTFVAMNDRGRPTAVHLLQPETEEEKQEYAAAEKRRKEYSIS